MSEAPGAWTYYVTGVSECSQQSGSLKGDGHTCDLPGDFCQKVVCIVRFQYCARGVCQQGPAIIR